MLPQSNNPFRLTGLSPSLAELSSSLQLGKLLISQALPFSSREKMQLSCNPQKTYGPRSFCHDTSVETQFNEFRLLPFRSPLLRECTSTKATVHKPRIYNACLQSEALAKDCFLFLRLLRCFNSPGYHLTALCVQAADIPPFCGMGFPIRKSTDQRLLAT